MNDVERPGVAGRRDGLAALGCAAGDGGENGELFGGLVGELFVEGGEERFDTLTRDVADGVARVRGKLRGRAGEGIEIGQKEIGGRGSGDADREIGDGFQIDWGEPTEVARMRRAV